MPKSGEGDTVRVYEEEEEAEGKKNNGENNNSNNDGEEEVEDDKKISTDGGVLNAAVTVVADKDGESTITLVGDVSGKVAFLTVSFIQQ
jgi:ribose-phosphate pyrophosphokinase